MTTVPRLLISILLLLLAILPTGVLAAVTVTATGSQGSLGILHLDADPLRTMTPVPFRLEVNPADGGALASTPVRCSLTMPAMPMPPNHPRVQGGDGAFRGEMVFTMAGAWQATFQVARDDGSEETFLFDLDPVLLK